jgi:hypothetical protein
MFPSNGTRNDLRIFLNAYKNIPQEHGYIVVAFHQEVFGYHSIIFSKGRHGVKVSNRDIDKVT